MPVRVWVEPGALAALVDEARRAFPDETGGILIGYSAPGSAVVTRVVGPGPSARHCPDSFEPDDDFHAAAIESIFAETRGGEWYLGDWHTHPDGGLYLSRKDLSVLSKIANYKESALDHPIMLIVTTDDGFRAAAWRFRKRWFRSSVEPCELILE